MPGPLRRRYAVTVPLVIALAALIVAGCGDDDKDKSSKAPDEPSKATTTRHLAFFLLPTRVSRTRTDIGSEVSPCGILPQF